MPPQDILESLAFYLIPMASETVFTGRVTSTPADPYITIAYNTGVTGSFGAPLPGQTVLFGTTSGGSERGKRRLKAWSGGSAGTITIDESDDVGPIIRANDYITIKNEFRLWPKYPRFVQSGTKVTIYEDYSTAYSNQNDKWRPIAVAGPPGVAFLQAGVGALNFVGDRSFALAQGASITSYLWTAWSSVEGTSTAKGTEASPVSFSWTAAGRYLVSLKVTDSNGNTHTAYTWAIIIDPADPTTVAFLKFDAISDSTDFNQGGGESGFTVRGDISIGEFPEEMMVVHAVRGTVTTNTGTWPFRGNVLFVGWVQGDSVRQNPDTGDVTFRAGTIDSVMRNTTMFPVSLADAAQANNWTEATGLNVDRAASFLWRERSTLASMTPIIPTNFSGLIRRQDFGPGDLYSQLQSGLLSSILGKVVSTAQGVLYHLIDYNVQNATERATATTRKRLHKGIWVNDVAIDERADYGWPANQVKMSGIYYPGGQIEDICPLFSEAPGDAPKSYGRENNFDRLILLSQTDLNTRSGHMLEKLNQRYVTYRMQFVNDGSFTIGPQELFPATIEAGDNDRALALTPSLIPRRISREYDHVGGYFITSVDFEPVTSGQPGSTVDMPCGPPEQKLPSTVPVAPPPGSQAAKLALIAGTTGTSWYFAPGVGQTWAKRVSGLVSPTQLRFEDTIDDPWSGFKQGYNAESIITWGCGKGFLVRSKNSGKNWTSRGELLSPAPNWPGETGTVVSEMTMIRLQADIFTEDALYVLGTWQRNGAWHSAVAVTTDGFNFTWHNLTGSSQARALGMSLDRGNGSNLWITTWENEPTGTLYLRHYNAKTLALNNKYSLGAATIGQVGSQTYYASPFNRLLQACEVFVFGRMNNPQSLGNPVQVLVNDNCGATGSYSVIENSWDTDLCGSFGADADGYYYAVRNK